MLVITSHVGIPDEEIALTYVRSSGPGGQNVNKVNSKAVLRWRATENRSLPEGVRQRLLKACASRLTADGDLLITSQRYRDQGRNAEDCRDKLRQLIASVVVPPKVRKKSKPSRAAHTRRLASKTRHGEKKLARRHPAGDE